MQNLIKFRIVSIVEDVDQIVLKNAILEVKIKQYDLVNPKLTNEINFGWYNFLGNSGCGGGGFSDALSGFHGSSSSSGGRLGC